MKWKTTNLSSLCGPFLNLGRQTKFAVVDKSLWITFQSQKVASKVVCIFFLPWQKIERLSWNQRLSPYLETVKNVKQKKSHKPNHQNIILNLFKRIVLAIINYRLSCYSKHFSLSIIKQKSQINSCPWNVQFRSNSLLHQFLYSFPLFYDDRKIQQLCVDRDWF